MKRKKITALLAVLAMTVSLAAGCGNAEKAGAVADNAAEIGRASCRDRELAGV